MTYALAAIALASIGLAGTLAVWLHQSTGRERNALDVIDSERKLSAQYMHERDVEVAAHAVTSAQLKDTQGQLSIVEAQRNDAWRTAREHIAEQIMASDLDDAVAVGNRILSAPLPGVPLSESGDSALEKP